MTEDTEQEILTRWERLKKWWEILKFGKWLYGLLFLTTGTLAYGEITQTNPLRAAAVEVGLIEPTTDEIVDQIIDDYKVIKEEEKAAEHSHSHTHDLSKELSNIIPEDHMELH